MRLTHISEYNYETMELARPIIDFYRRTLLAAGRPIHPKYLSKIKEMGIEYVFVDDTISRGISLEEMLDMPTWIDSIETVQAVFEHAKQTDKMLTPLLIHSLQATANQLVNEVKHRKAIVLIPASTVPEQLKKYAHSVNTALLTLSIAKRLNFHDIQLRDLSLGALLHDIGKMVSNDEHSHPEAGFNYLKRHREFSLLSAHIAFQHHELLNGKGYPRGIKGNDFHDYAQLCGLANRYENMISFQKIEPYAAMEQLMALADYEYTQRFLDALFRSVPAYPPGTKVMINNGIEAIVIRIDNHLQRPVVRTLDTHEEICLADEPTKIITKVISA